MAPKIPCKNSAVSSPGHWHVVLLLTAQVEGIPARRQPGTWCQLFLHAPEFVLGPPVLRPVQKTFNSQKLLDLRQP
jgi:hypothetical protein